METVILLAIFFSYIAVVSGNTGTNCNGMQCSNGCCNSTSNKPVCCNNPIDDSPDDSESGLPSFSLFFYALTTFVLFLLITCCVGKIVRLKQRRHPNSQDTSNNSRNTSGSNNDRPLMVTTIGELLSRGLLYSGDRSPRRTTDPAVPVAPPSYDDAIKTPPPELPPSYDEICIERETRSSPVT